MPDLILLEAMYNYMLLKEDTNKLKVKGRKNKYHTNTNQKKARMTILITEKSRFLIKEYCQG